MFPIRYIKRGLCRIIHALQFYFFDPKFAKAAAVLSSNSGDFLTKPLTVLPTPKTLFYSYFDIFDSCRTLCYKPARLNIKCRINPCIFECTICDSIHDWASYWFIRVKLLLTGFNLVTHYSLMDCCRIKKADQKTLSYSPNEKGCPRWQPPFHFSRCLIILCLIFSLPKALYHHPALHTAGDLRRC